MNFKFPIGTKELRYNTQKDNLYFIKITKRKSSFAA